MAIIYNKNSKKYINSCDLQNSKDGKKSEMLPRGWNDNQELYTLRYKPAERSSNVYLLKIIRIDDDLLVHFMVCYSSLYGHNLYCSKWVNNQLCQFDNAVIVLRQAIILENKSLYLWRQYTFSKCSNNIIEKSDQLYSIFFVLYVALAWNGNNFVLHKGNNSCN